MKDTFANNRFIASLACALFTCAALVDGMELLHYVKFELFWSYEITAASAGLLGSACCAIIAGWMLGGRFRLLVLEQRDTLAWVLSATSAVGHALLIALPEINTSSDCAAIVVEALVPLCALVPTTLAAGLSSSLAWGSSRLADALCFPCAMVAGVFLSDALGIFGPGMGLCFAMAGTAALVTCTHSANEEYCERVAMLASPLDCFGQFSPRAESLEKWGIGAMTALACSAVNTLVPGIDLPLVIAAFALVVYFYDGDLRTKAAGITAAALACFVLWLGISTPSRSCFLALLTCIAALAHSEFGPKGLMMNLGAFIAAVGLSEAICESIRYPVIAAVCETALPLIAVAALLVAFCRPDSKLVSIWKVPRKSTTSDASMNCFFL